MLLLLALHGRIRWCGGAVFFREAEEEEEDGDERAEGVMEKREEGKLLGVT